LTVPELEHKLKEDGKAIAGLQQAVHNLKGGPHSKSGKNGFSNIPRLLGSVEEQETAWMLAVTNCKDHAARIPISQVTGAVPVDLYRRTEFASTTTNAAGEGFIMTQPDVWNTAGLITTASTMAALLHPDGVASTYGSSTGSTYAGTTFPAVGVLAVGVTALQLGDVSSNFVAGADGTEYIQVGKISSLRAKQVANAAADARYSGVVTAFYSVDVERYPIVGVDPAVLRAQAEAQDASVFAMRYIITEDGLFVPEDEPRATVLSEISTASMPLSSEAYQWQRIDGYYASTTYTAAHCDAGFHIEAPSGSQFELETTMLWQTERYASNKVAPAKSVTAAAGLMQHSDTTQPVWHLDLGTGPGDHSGYGWDETFVVVHSGQTERVTTPTTPQKKLSMKKRKHARYHGGPGAPPVALLMGNAVAPLPGKPVAPALAPMSVIESVQQSPGVRTMLARDMALRGPSGLSNIASPSVASMVAGQPSGSTKAAHSKWNWKSILSGAWDLAKVVAPAILALL
jgi:hypothetical protein